MAWSHDRTELLKKLWADGLSASQIAGELGGITRNAVIGKVHRLGLSGRLKATSTPRQRKPRPHLIRQERQAPAGTTALSLAYANPEEDAPPVIEQYDSTIPLGQRRTLLELSPETCRWPIGDPCESEFFFCGGRPIQGKFEPGKSTCIPYCVHHCIVAYQPAHQRRRTPAWR